MSRKPSAALSAALKSEKREPSASDLARLRSEVARVRDVDLEIERLEQRLREEKEKKNTLVFKTLPDLFHELGVREMTIDADGNLPAFTAKASAYYHANISADWPDEQRAAGFKYLRDEKAGDLIKQVFTVELGRGTAAQQREVRAALKKLGVPFSVDESVPWNTLTAWVRECVEKRNKTPKLDVIGATVGAVVKIAPVRERGKSATEERERTY